MKRRTANLVLVTLAAIGAGAASYSVPAGLLESAANRIGIASIFPQAAPPFGGMALTMFWMVCALAGAGVTAAFLPWKRRRNRRANWPEAGFFDADLRYAADDILPVLRRADAHPDAPPRPPLFASRDLGDELPRIEVKGDDPLSMRPVDQTHAPLVYDITGLALPRAPEPLPWETIQHEMDRLLAGVRFRAVEDSPAREAIRNREPSIEELTRRLERGLARRRAVAGEQVEADEKSSAVANDMVGKSAPTEAAGDTGDDLMTALAALKSVTARAG